MNQVYARDLDLNLLRVLVAVADTGSVTTAAAQLYLTQPAISAALRRLTTAVGDPLVARHGRGIVLTERGARLVAEVRPHLEAMIAAALAPPVFDPKTSERTLRVGLSDTSEHWLLPPLLRVLEREAPRMKLIALPVTFRTVAEMLAARRVDLAVTVADDLPGTIARRSIMQSGFVCVFDPRHARIGRRVTEAQYFAHKHVIVSYNGDLRGVVEDALGKQRDVRCSVASFTSLGAILEGSALVATVPEMVARTVMELRPKLRSARLPFAFDTTGARGTELLWPTSLETDDAHRFVRDAIVKLAAACRAR